MKVISAILIATYNHFNFELSWNIFLEMLIIVFVMKPVGLFIIKLKLERKDLI